MSTLPVATEAPDPAKLPGASPAKVGWRHSITKERLLVVGIVLALAAVCVVFHTGRVSTNDAQVQGHIVTIAPHIPGYVNHLKIDDNVKVNAGDVLFTIDPRDYQVRFEEASQAYESALAQRDAAHVAIEAAQSTATASSVSAAASIHAQEATFTKDQESLQMAAGPELDAAQAVARAKQAVALRSAADLERYRPLVKTGEISQLQFDAFSASAKVAESEATQALALVDRAQHAVLVAKSQVAFSGAGVDRERSDLPVARARALEVAMRIADWKAAQSVVGRTKALADEARLNLSYATITSPVSGVITNRTVEIGQFVQPGQATLQVIPLNDVWVVANFKETQLAHVRPGQRARIHIDSLGIDVDAWVDSIAGSTGSRQALLPPENATGNFVKVVERIPVKLRIRNGQVGEVLRPGMNVEATIYTR